MLGHRELSENLMFGRHSLDEILKVANLDSGIKLIHHPDLFETEGPYKYAILISLDEILGKHPYSIVDAYSMPKECMQ